VLVSVTDDDRAAALLSRYFKEGRKFTMSEFAKTLGVPRTQLYRRDRFPSFWALRKAYARSLRPGCKEGDTGRIEAEDYEDWGAIDEALDSEDT
jgi:hypothetical protein